MNQDFVDLLRAFIAHDVRFLIAEAWPSRLRAPFGAVDVDYLGKDAFIRNKRASGRTKDLADLEELL